MTATIRCRFVPPYLLERVATLHRDDPIGACCRSTLVLDEELRGRRSTEVGAVERLAAGLEGPFTVYSAENDTRLPGTVVRGRIRAGR